MLYLLEMMLQKEAFKIKYHLNDQSLDDLAASSGWLET